LKTLELVHRTVEVDMRAPVVAVIPRGANYKFMAAEAYWIINGDNSLAGIVPYNSVMAKFSDDGKTLAGAYGVPLSQQIGYVINKLEEDHDTRQAVMTFWRPNPLPSKDIPCTVALDFKIRDGKLNLHVFMRSSDQWLGLPYDIFSFSMIAYAVMSCLNSEHRPWSAPTVKPGTLYLTAASSHIYEAHWSPAKNIVSDYHNLAGPKWRAANPHSEWLMPDDMWNGSAESRDVWLGRLAGFRDAKQPFMERFNVG
jgi:thymidylate synthase